ncbi:MAG: SHOCT domain-containing protein [Sedimenticolaceae bacterium]
MGNRKFASAVMACVIGTGMVGMSTPVAASDAGAFIGGVFATKLIGGIREQNDATERQAAATEQLAAQQQASGGSTEHQLSELKSMKDKGLINAEEYNQKKKQILDSM